MQVQSMEQAPVRVGYAAIQLNHDVLDRVLAWEFQGRLTRDPYELTLLIGLEGAEELEQLEDESES